MKKTENKQAPIEKIFEDDTSGFNNYPILVIDNDRMILKLFEKYLRAFGFKPYLSTDPYEGVRLAVKYRPMAIILDVVMPEIDGDIVMKLLKRIDITSEIPIMLLSTDINLDLINKTWKEGASDYLAKPFNFETLYRKLSKLLHLNSYTSRQAR